MLRQVFISIFFMVVAFMQLSAQAPARNDREIAGLKGKVKLRVSCRYKYSEDGTKSPAHWESTDTAYYNKAGNLTLEIVYAADSTQNTRTTYTYNTNDRNVCRKASYYADNGLREEIITSYDSEGNRAECRKTDCVDRVTDIERYFYDDKHRCSRIMHYRSEMYFTTGDSNKVTEEVRNTFNEKGLVIKQENFDEQGHLKNTLTKAYNEAENITTYTSRDVIIHWIYANGKPVEANVFTRDNKLLGTSLYSHDLSGRQTSYKHYNGQGLVADDLTHDYECSDKRGNWLKVQICYMQKLTVYEERKIMYYR